MCGRRRARKLSTPGRRAPPVKPRRLTLGSGNATLRPDMPVPSALACVRCNARYPIDHYAEDCPACRAARVPANLTVAYEGAPGATLKRDEPLKRAGSMWRWDKFLHASAEDAVTLGEGNTPLLPAPSLGLGDVWIKDESRNPTWSFKGRLGSGALTMARRFGAKVIASSSSGNAGRRRLLMPRRPAFPASSSPSWAPPVCWSCRCVPMAPWS